MTTIAYRRGIMACDSAWSDENDSFQTLQNKMVRLSSGAVLGEAGDNDSRHVHQLLDKVKSFDKMPSALELSVIKLNYTALIAFPNGEVAIIACEHEDSSKEWRGRAYKVTRGFAAIGSGGQFAIGFMGADNSARDAVAFACQFDPFSRPPIHTMSVALIKPRRK